MIVSIQTAQAEVLQRAINQQLTVALTTLQRPHVSAVNVHFLRICRQLIMHIPAYGQGREGSDRRGCLRAIEGEAGCGCQQLAGAVGGQQGRDDVLLKLRDECRWQVKRRGARHCREQTQKALEQRLQQQHTIIP